MSTSIMTNRENLRAAATWLRSAQLICPPADTGIWLGAGVIDTRGCDVRLHDDPHIDAACQASVRRKLRHPPFTSSLIGEEAMRRIGAL